MNLSIVRNTFVVVASLFAVSFSGCQAVDSHFDCNKVCTKYHDCFDGDYDIAKCTDRCQSNATNNDNYYVDVNNCESCIDGKSCGGSFACVGECSTVVP